ncbi:MAG: VOC family protein [Casimicrobiaceae bacterium]
MIDHLTISIGDLDAARAFYRAALAPLGYAPVMEYQRNVGFGSDGKPDFWIAEGKPNVPPVHVAFVAATRAAVDAFHRAALLAGGRDNGKPGLRPQYHEHYYGAFVLDADGHNIEAVCHQAA